MMAMPSGGRGRRFSCWTCPRHDRLNGRGRGELALLQDVLPPCPPSRQRQGQLGASLVLYTERTGGPPASAAPWACGRIHAAGHCQPAGLAQVTTQAITVSTVMIDLPIRIHRPQPTPIPPRLQAHQITCVTSVHTRSHGLSPFVARVVDSWSASSVGVRRKDLPSPNALGTLPLCCAVRARGEPG